MPHFPGSRGNAAAKNPRFHRTVKHLRINDIGELSTFREHLFAVSTALPGTQCEPAQRVLSNVLEQAFVY